ncbi:phosphopantetheine-binding protein, partial [Actinoplanes sp. NPDC049802]|uniref:phosphopantetheine-binding protein n=1 Tax=Actinoplanes sp. NPDC049802 TaxID=3154742 RepID=UPI003404DE15
REAVRFAGAVQVLRDRRVGTFLEIGPDAVLTGLVDEGAVASSRRDRDEARTVVEALGSLHARGVDVDWTGFFGGGGSRIDLPTYAFQRTRLWPDPPPAAPADDFWAAVDRDDLGSLLGLDGTATLQDVMTALSSWRRGPAPGYQLRWSPVAELPPPALTGVWLVPEDAGPIGAVMARYGADVRVYREATAEELLRPAPDRIVAGVLALPNGPAPETLIRALAEARLDAPLWYLTRGAVATTAGERITDPAGTAVWGFGRAAAVTTPRAWGGVVDLPETLGERTLGALCQVLGRGSGEDRVALRPAGVFACRLSPAAIPAGEPDWTAGEVAVHGGPLAERIAGLLAGAGATITTGPAGTVVVTSDGADPVGTALAAEANRLVLVYSGDELFGTGGDPGTAAVFDAIAHRRAGAVSVAVGPDLTAGQLGAAVVAGGTGRLLTAMDWAAFVPAYTRYRPSPLLRDLPEAMRHVAGPAGGAPATDDPDELRRLLDEADEAGQRALLSLVVRAQAAYTLGLPSADGVAEDHDFIDIGFASLTAVELRRRLEALTGLELTATLVYDHPTPAAVAEELLAQRALVNSQHVGK